MKIGILTQPLHANYGGLLQAYALQTVLTRLGHNVTIINREYNDYEEPIINNQTKKELVINYIKYFVKVLLGKEAFLMVPNNKVPLLWRNAKEFVEKYYNVSPTLYTDSQLSDYFNNNDFDCLIVGSDQVWRPSISPNIFNYFFDFAEHSKIKRLSYAASFGVDIWEYTSLETKKCTELAKLFDAISVREFSGIELCKKYLGVDAIHVLDPTLLLDKEEYIDLIECEHTGHSDGSLYYYVLDKTDTTQNLIHLIAKDQKLKPFFCNFKGYEKCYRIGYFEDSVYPPTTKWLRGFMDAEMVVTDSFHGTVFSIIFNKPFWVVGNKGRGLTRFVSLLKMFGLEDRLVAADKSDSIDYAKPINWEFVNEIRSELVQKSMDFLIENLKSSKI